jgi:hypothetical protein
MFLPIAHYYTLLTLSLRVPLLCSKTEWKSRSHTHTHQANGESGNVKEEEEEEEDEEDVSPPSGLIEAALIFLTLLEHAAPSGAASHLLSYPPTTTLTLIPITMMGGLCRPRGMQ